MDKLLIQVLQWEVGKSIERLGEKMDALMRFTSRDNVHVQAYTAAVDIGNLLTCSPSLIGQGSDSLTSKGKSVELSKLGVCLPRLVVHRIRLDA